MSPVIAQTASSEAEPARSPRSHADFSSTIQYVGTFLWQRGTFARRISLEHAAANCISVATKADR
jgi:hypothetical protein